MEHPITAVPATAASQVLNPVVLADRTPSAEHGGQVLTFGLQDEIYGLDILRVREIMEYTRPTTIPMMPTSVRGVINLRGRAVPVIDLALRFGRQATALRARTCIVIVDIEVEYGSQAVGILVDAVNAVLDLDGAQIEPTPSFGTGLHKEFIRGMARTDRGFVILLDVGHVLSGDDMAALAEHEGQELQRS